MRLLVTGACGFVGGALVHAFAEAGARHEITGLDNLSRPGSETNRPGVRALGVRLVHGDLRLASDFEPLAPVDWVIDAAANPSVLAGVDERTSSRQLVEHNLVGTLNTLEYCKRVGAGLILLSTSRVYSARRLAALSVVERNGVFEPTLDTDSPPGLTTEGIDEAFSTEPPLSLYGATKLASEALALEYGQAFDFPVWVNRCGLLAGAGQFGRPDQGILSYWVHSWRVRAPLRYLGFDGRGHQVRDVLHARDLVPLLEDQMKSPGSRKAPLQNVAGGAEQAISLRQLSEWCHDRFGAHQVASDPTPRPFDVPWLVLSSARARDQWGWRPQTPVARILEEIAQHAEAHPDWLEVSAHA